MTGRRFLAIALALLLFLTAGTAQAQTSSIPVIIKLAPSAPILPVLNWLTGTLIDVIPESNIYLLNAPNLSILQSQPSWLLNPLQLLGIQWFEVNVAVPQLPHLKFGVIEVPPSTPPDWYKNQPAMQLIRSNEAQAYSTGLSVVVADINSKVDIGHPAIQGHLTGGYDFVETKPSGYAALNQSSASFMDQSSASFMDQSSASFMDAENAGLTHGTLTVGVIAAIAPDAMIMPLRVFDDEGEADLFIIAKAIHHAARNGAQVINMSFGTLENSKALKDAVDYAKSRGVMLVASAGNSNTSAPQYPAAWNGVLTTAATTLTDEKASFSNYGSYVFVDAPGVNIISPYPGGRYAMVSGTSFSAPAVAGTVALIRSLRTTGISSSIASSAVDIDSKNPQYQNKLGYGRIDVLGAVRPD